jgi:hypothetical protein
MIQPEIESESESKSESESPPAPELKPEQKESEDIYYIQLCCMYLDENSTIEKIKREKYFLKQVNLLEVEDLKTLLKKGTGTTAVKKEYYPFCLLKYQAGELVSLRKIETILFEKSPALDHEFNELIIIYHKYETTRQIQVSSKKKTRKIIRHPPSK